MSENVEKTGEVRDDKGRFKKGVSGNYKGMPPETEEQHNKKVAKKKVIAEYEEELRKMLPEAKRVLQNKLKKDDMFAVKEVHDRVMGKPRQTVGLDGGEEGEPINIISYVNAAGKIQKK